MTARDNRDAWGALAGKVGDVVEQIRRAHDEGRRLEGEGAMGVAQGAAGLGQFAIDLPRAYATGNAIHDKWAERANAEGRVSYDNDIDAQRHAEWSAEMARMLGPTYARVVTSGWEFDPFQKGTKAAHEMDLYNNSVGIQSVENGRPYALDNLQLAPGARAKAPWPSTSRRSR